MQCRLVKHEKYSTDGSFVDFLTNKRSSTSNSKTPPKSKQINVAAGKSIAHEISAQDLVEANSSKTTELIEKKHLLKEANKELAWSFRF